MSDRRPQVEAEAGAFLAGITADGWWAAAATSGEDDDWCVGSGADNPHGIAQMVWRCDAEFIAAAPRLVRELLASLAAVARERDEARHHQNVNAAAAVVKSERLRVAERSLAGVLEERAELAAAISADPSRHDHKGLVALAQAHRSDSEDVDANLEERDAAVQEQQNDTRHVDQGHVAPISLPRSPEGAT